VNGRLFRVLRAVVVGLLVWELVYVVAANAILRTKRLDHWVTGATKGLFLETGPAWSIWPGRVHARRVELHFEDYNIQFSVVVENAVVDIALWQLPTKTFHVTRLRGDGVRYLLRHKVQSARGHERRLAQYPRIAGYSDPPLFEGPHPPPLTDEQYNLWTIHLQDVDAQVSELWFLEVRFLGTGRVRGGFRLVPERNARTEPCTLALNGHLLVGPRTMASVLQGRIEAQLDEHDPRVVEGAAIFGKISFRTDLEARIPSLAFTELYAEKSAPHFSRGRGTLRMQTDLKHGIWNESTRIRYDTHDMTARLGPLVASGPTEWTAHIVRGGRDSRVELALDSAALKVSSLDAPAERAASTIGDLHAGVGATADLTRPIKLTSLRSRERVKLNVKDRQVSASMTMHARLSYDTEAHTGHLSELELDVPELSVSKGDKSQAIPGGIHARSERLSWREVEPLEWVGGLEADAESIEPLLPLLISSEIERGIASAIAQLGKSHVSLQADQGRSALQLQFAARSGKVEANGVLLKERNGEQPMCGRVFIHQDELGVGIVLYQGRAAVRPLVSPQWWRNGPPVESCGPEKIPPPIITHADGIHLPLSD
jgi:hypothetical protein